MDNKSFHYTYSAMEQSEIQKIREKYIPKDTDRLEELRRLDKSVTDKASAWSIAIGVAGMAVLGAAYPVYNRILRREREKITPEILRLTDELMK